MGTYDRFKHWSFDGIAFARVVTSNDIPLWFDGETIVQVDTIIGSTNRYVDVGGIQYPPLQLRIATDVRQDRDNLMQKHVDTVAGILQNAVGYTTRCIIIKAARINRAGLYMADVTFQVVPPA